MIRVLAYEYLTCECNASAAAAGASLFTEGWAMLAAAVEDLLAVPDVEVIVPLPEATVISKSWERATIHRFAHAEIETGLGHLAKSCDFALIVAPEFDRILESRCQLVVEAGAKLLGPSVEAIKLTGDKLALCEHLQRTGNATPPTMPFIRLPPFSPPWVVKPRFGAGSQDMYLVRDSSEWPDDIGATSIIQTFVPGFAASAAFVIGSQQIIALPPCEQRLSSDGRFRYLGGRSPIEPDLAARATRLAMAAITAVPGLSGFVGVDLVLGETDMVIEINPRLTTSYIGLRQLVEGNLAEAMLKLAMGGKYEMSWRNLTVEW